MLTHQLKFTSSHSIQVSQLHSKNQNQNKVNNHYVVTQTASALQTTQQKCVSWAPVKGWREDPGVSRRVPPWASHFGCQRMFTSHQTTQKGEHEAWRPGLWGISLRGHSLLATLPEMTKWHCVSHGFVTFGAMSHFCTTGKDQLELETVASGRTDSGVCFEFHLHRIYFPLTNNWAKRILFIWIYLWLYVLKCYTASATRGVRNRAWKSLRWLTSLLWNKHTAKCANTLKGFQGSLEFK